jgi:hypothetical protein
LTDNKEDEDFIKLVNELKSILGPSFTVTDLAGMIRMMNRYELIVSKLRDTWAAFLVEDIKELKTLPKDDPTRKSSIHMLVYAALYHNMLVLRSGVKEMGRIEDLEIAKSLAMRTFSEQMKFTGYIPEAKDFEI